MYKFAQWLYQILRTYGRTNNILNDAFLEIGHGTSYCVQFSGKDPV